MPRTRRGIRVFGPAYFPFLNRGYSASLGAEPAAVEASTTLFTNCREMAQNSFLLTLHRDFPLYADMMGDNRGQQWFFANLNMDSWAEAG